MEHFVATLTGNNNIILIENDVEKVWVLNQAIFEWFPTLAGIHAKSRKILIITFLSRTNGK